MFRCQLCDVVVSPRTPAHRLVVATRPAKYPARLDVNRKIPCRPHSEDDPGGTGRETARELTLCPSCASARESVGPSAWQLHEKIPPDAAAA